MSQISYNIGSVEKKQDRVSSIFGIFMYRNIIKNNNNNNNLHFCFPFSGEYNDIGSTQTQLKTKKWTKLALNITFHIFQILVFPPLCLVYSSEPICPAELEQNWLWSISHKNSRNVRVIKTPVTQRHLHNIGFGEPKIYKYSTWKFFS